MGDITKRYGDGSIMRLGEAHKLMVEAIPPARYLSISRWVWAASRAAVSPRYMDRSLPVRPRSASILLPRRRNSEAPALTSIWNMLWTLPMLSVAVWT